MTLKEAKNILKKEGFHLVLASKVINQTGAIREFEKPEVCEAIKVANANKWTVGLSPIEWDEREALLKEEYEKNHIKCGEPIPGSPLSAVEGAKLKWKDNQNTSVNPALKEAASQFNDALLDEQAKKIKRLGKEIARLNNIIHKKNLKIEELKKERSEHLAGEVKFFGETVDLSQELCDKNEELRLSKIREKNLTEVCQKYMKENEELKKELADKVVDKIDAQALKSAESALAYKDKVIADLTKKLNVKHKKYVYYNGTIVAVHRLVNTLAGYAAKRYYKELCDQMVDIAEEGGDQSASIVVQCDNGIILSKEEAEIIERCTKNGTELHYSEKDGFTYTNVFDEEMPIRCLRGMFHVFTDEEIKNMKK